MSIKETKSKTKRVWNWLESLPVLGIIFRPSGSQRLAAAQRRAHHLPNNSSQRRAHHLPNNSY